MDVSRSFLWPLLSGVIAVVALVCGALYFAKGTFPHNQTVAAPAATVGPAAITIAAADAALQRGDRKGALAQAQAAVNLAPLDASIAERAGQIARDAGDLAAAQQDLTLAEIAAPRDSTTYVALSDILIREGKPRAAEAPLRFGIVRNPHAPMLHYNLALLELARGDEVDAIDDFHKEPRSSPVYGAAQIGIAMTPGHASHASSAHVAASVAPAPTPVVVPVAQMPAVQAPTPVPYVPTTPPVVATPAPPPPPVIPVVPAVRAAAVETPAHRAVPVALHTSVPRRPASRVAETRRVIALREQPRPTPVPSLPTMPPPLPTHPPVPRALMPVSTITAPPPASDKLEPVETVTAAPPVAPPSATTP
ncbi:MAG TPA: tetratricopeptide repeat protein [Candidatus Acidoferrales bacterium]|nr:tetratricopeptide repeat protein [Candidatus Acidoferrales bacterium]